MEGIYIYTLYVYKYTLYVNKYTLYLKIIVCLYSIPYAQIP